MGLGGLGNDLYAKDELLGAIEKYLLAIESFEAEAGDDPEDLGHRKSLAVLYSNRAQAALALVKRSPIRLRHER